MRGRNTKGSSKLALGWLARAFVIGGLLGATVAHAADGDQAFLAAREAFQRGQIDRLTRLANEVVGHPLESYVTYWQLRSRLNEVSPADIDAFLRDQADTLVGQRMRGDWLKQLGKRQEWETFLREYPRFALEDTEVTCYALQARLTRQDSAALREARPLWFQGTPQPDSCASLFDSLRAQGLLGEEDLWLRFRLALESGNIGFAKSLAAWLPPERRFDGRQLEAAARNPQRFLDRRPLPLKQRAERELAVFATWRLAQSLPMVAANRLERFDGQLSSEERGYAWGQVALGGALKLRPEALDWFKRAGDTPLSDRQLSWKVRMALRAGDWQTVIAAADAMSPKERQFGGWRYWKARALIATGKSAEGESLLAPLASEHNFYGQLASEELGTVTAAVPAPHYPSAEEQLAMERNPGIQRALRLYELGLRYEGALEWRWNTRSFDDRQLLAAADVARRAGWYERAIDTAERTRELHDFSMRFPSPYREVVSGYARQLDLDEAWVYGLMRQESRFTTDARSSTGAQGLMQLMPSTAKHVARRLGLAGYNRRHVTSVETNVNLGTYHLRQLMDNLDNQPMLASAAYNAGLSRARDWRADRPLEGAVYVESIPFTETRDYVRKVMSSSMYYARLFGEAFIPLKQRLGSVGSRPLANE